MAQSPRTDQTPVTPSVKDPNNTFTSTMNVPGGLSTVKSRQFGEIKEEDDPEDKNKASNVTAPITPKNFAGSGAISPQARNLMRNPTEKTLN